GQIRQRHAVRWVNLQPNLEHHYRLVAPSDGERPVQSRRMQFDTSFHYAPAAVPPAPPSPDLAWLTSPLASRPATQDGYALVAGAVDGRLALELVRQSRLKVVVVDPDPTRVAAARRTLSEAGVYGVRASVHRQAGDVLPYGDLFANLVTSERTWVEGTPPPVPVAELERLLRPSGGTVALQSSAATDPARWQAWLGDSPWAAVARRESGRLQLGVTRGRLPGSGEWTHQYGNADNSACSQDELVRGDLRVAWWGDPGPRPMPDRGNRNPAPLSVNGRLFIQGNRILFGLDAYNGAILWSLSAPGVRRANVTRDSSNMAAFGDRLYVAHRRYCLALDGQTGARVRRYAVAGDAPAGEHEWGYLAAGDGWLVGSRVKRDSTYLGDDGEWYEDFAADQVARLGSDRLFALDTATGDARWVYTGGLILNSTITIADGMLFFIESLHPAARAHPSSRVPVDLLADQQLVCLDLRTGRRVWQKSHDFSACQFMTYLVYGGNTVVVTGTDRDKHYHTFAFSAPALKPAAGTGDDVEGALGGRLL
ncbi:MAG: PQQ-binding-like beta-propeller repeat protein, partial [Verrucomicrobiota bacterium]